MGTPHDLKGPYLKAAQPFVTEVTVPVFKMPETPEGKPRFPTRSDGAERAVMCGAVGKARIQIS